MKELNSELTFLCSYEQRMVVVSGNTGSAPKIGSKVIRDRASNRSVWSERGVGSKVRCQIRRKLRPVRGGPDSRWNGKAPLVLYSIIIGGVSSGLADRESWLD